MYLKFYSLISHYKHIVILRNGKGVNAAF